MTWIMSLFNVFEQCRFAEQDVLPREQMDFRKWPVRDYYYTTRSWKARNGKSRLGLPWYVTEQKQKCFMIAMNV